MQESTNIETFNLNCIKGIRVYRHLQIPSIKVRGMFSLNSSVSKHLLIDLYRLSQSASKDNNSETKLDSAKIFDTWFTGYKKLLFYLVLNVCSGSCKEQLNQPSKLSDVGLKSESERVDNRRHVTCFEPIPCLTVQ